MTNLNVDPIDPDHQANAILAALTRWLEAAPGRRVTMARTPEGWRATLDAHTPASGESLVDALAQVTQIAAFEVRANDGA